MPDQSELQVGQWVSIRPRFGERGRIIEGPSPHPTQEGVWYKVEIESAPCPLWYSQEELTPLRDKDSGFRWA